MNEEYYRKFVTLGLLFALAILVFSMLKPVLLSAVLGILFSFMFMPVYKWMNKFIKQKTVSALIICILLIVLILLPFWFFTPIVIDQSIQIYTVVQKADFITPLKAFFPKFFASEKFSAEVGSILYSFTTNAVNYAVNEFSSIILNAPTLIMQLFVVLFTLFFMLRDQDEFLSYLESLLPFSESVQKKLFQKTKDITASVIFGTIIMGGLQGILTGIGFFIFGVPNALLMTLLAIIVGILPIVGTSIIWIPIVVYLFVSGNNISGIGVLIFGLASAGLDNLLKPIIVSQRSEMHPSLILFGIVGGFFLFGALGFLLGPLILAYLLIIVEVYRNKSSDGVFIQHPVSK